MAYMTGYPILGITSNMVQLLIVDYDRTDMHVLSYYEAPHKAMKDGNLVDAKELVAKIKQVYEKTNFFLNAQIHDAILVFPDAYSLIHQHDVYLDLSSEGTEITLKHIQLLLKGAANQLQDDGQVLLNIFPTSFTVSGVTDIENPRGLIGQNVELSGFSITGSKDLFMNILYSVEQANVNLLEVMPTFYCNMVEVMQSLQLKSGATVIDVGYEHTMISIYEEGVPRKSRYLSKGMNGLIQILMEKYQITAENATDVLLGSVYLDEESAEDIIVYRLELPTGVLDITEQDLIQTLSEYIRTLLSDIQGIVEHFSAYQMNPLVFIGGMLKIAGMRELILRSFDPYTIYFHEGSAIGLREFVVTPLLGCAKLIPQREKLLEQVLEVAKTEDIVLEEDKKGKNPVRRPNKSEKSFWDKITHYFFD